MGEKRAVTVIGLGPMGQAIVQVLLERGYPVTVWNRTASRADDLVALGAERAESVEEALGAAELVLLTLTDYAAMYALLEPCAAALSGRTVANLSSATPEQARAGARWAQGHGARYLVGGLGVSAPMVGTSEGFSYYSGPQELVEEFREVLEEISRIDYRGEDPGLAQLWYQLQIGLFWTSLTSYLHLVAVAEAHGIGPAELLPYASETAASLPQFLEFYTPRLEAGDHSGSVDRLAMGVASVEHVVQTARDAGVDAALPQAVLEVFRRGVAAGYGGESATSLVKLFRQG